MVYSRFLRIILCTALLGAIAQQQSVAGCSTEIRILGDDLVDIKLSPQQTQLLNDRILRAKRYCFYGEENKAMDLINAARELSGLQPTTGEFDWENIPIEDLNRQPTN
ncbi:MAG: hypothetical protein O3A65_01550 [Proteobacteria bacterium]|nr:hypothetical protein [Pseudomonadota bacterium]